VSSLKDNASKYLSKIAGFVGAIPIVQFLEDRKEVDTFDIANELRLDMDVIIKAEGTVGGGQGKVIGRVYDKLQELANNTSNHSSISTISLRFSVG
jgi:hypothetical protein